MINQTLDTFAQKIVEPTICYAGEKIPQCAQSDHERGVFSLIFSRIVIAIPAPFLLFAPTVCPMLTVAAVVMAVYGITDLPHLFQLIEQANSNAQCKEFHRRQPKLRVKGQAAEQRLREEIGHIKAAVPDIIEQLKKDHEKAKSQANHGRGGVVDTIATRLLESLGYEIHKPEEEQLLDDVEAPQKKISPHSLVLMSRTIVCLGAGAMAALCTATAPVSAVAAGALSFYAAIGFLYEQKENRSDMERFFWLSMEHQLATHDMSMLEILLYSTTQKVTRLFMKDPPQRGKRLQGQAVFTRNVAPLLAHRAVICIAAAAFTALSFTSSPLVATAGAVVAFVSGGSLCYLSLSARRHRNAITGTENSEMSNLLKDWNQKTSATYWGTQIWEGLEPCFQRLRRPRSESY